MPHVPTFRWKRWKERWKVGSVFGDSLSLLPQTQDRQAGKQACEQEAVTLGGKARSGWQAGRKVPDLPSHSCCGQGGQLVRYLPLTHGAFHISCQTAPALHDVALCFSRGATREENSSPILHRPWTWVTPNQGTSFSHVERGADDDGHMLGGKQSQPKYPVTSDTLPHTVARCIQDGDGASEPVICHPRCI